MATALTERMAPADMLVFGTAVGLAGLAVFNYASGIYGGAIVSSVGAIVATLFGLLSN